MAAPFTAVLSSSIGVADLQLLSYSKSIEPQFDQAGRPYARKITYRCDGEIASDTKAALATALTAFQSAMTGGPVGFTITGSGTGRESVAALDCLDGPRFSGRYAGSAGPTHQGVSFEVEAVVAFTSADEDGLLSDEYSARKSVNHEGLLVITMTGKAYVRPLKSASSYVVSRAIPERPAGYQQTYDYQVSESDLACDYSVTQTQLLNDYPADANPPGDRVVDGERTITTDYDEHNRKVTRYQYAYVGPYALTYVEAQHAAIRAAGGLVRASIATTHHKTQSVNAAFEVMACRNEDDEAGVLEMAEEVSHTRSGPLLQEYRYPGVSPLIAQAADCAYLYEQSGRAVGLGVFLQEPPPLLAAANYLEAPAITVRRVDDVHTETTWRYRWLFASEQAVTLPSQRSDVPGVYVET
ncbi:MAG: hypothetical protein ABFD92_00030 [Planctomycetaceae bacterium]|nr:hypothetical protein [Planctomycetaceae bacterium]